MSNNRALSILFLVAFVWGFGYVLTQYALDENWSVLQIIALRFIIGGIVLSAIFYKKLITIKKADIISGSIVGFCLLTTFVLQTTGQKYSSPAISAFVIATGVVIVPFVDWFLFKKKLDTYAMFATALTLVGIGLIVLTGSLNVSLGIFLTLAGALFAALHICCVGYYVNLLDPICLTLVAVNFTAAISGFYVLINGLIYNNFPIITFKGLGSVVFLGILSTALCFSGQAYAQKFTTSTKASIILSTECVFGALCSIIVYKEILTVQTIIGCAIVFFAIILSETKFAFLKIRINKGGTLNGGKK